MTPIAGDLFGPYEILGRLGRGGVGDVYRAWDSRLEREVALKLLHDDYPQPGSRQRFLQEARAASALNHPNICTIFDMGEKDGAPYLVMELLRGETLKQRIERGSLPSEEIAQYGMEIAEALSAAHALGIVHRDIKPANIFLMKLPDGRARVKVLDFGLVKLTATLPGSLLHRDEHLTVVGEAVGTVSYMSPEQARGEDLDGRSDLFSLGVVMYEMATRRTPFHGSTTALLFVQLLNHPPEPIKDWNESVPRPLEKAILHLLEKSPGKRYQKASEASAALAGLVNKPSSSRWRRATAPPVPLVRVEEPVARAGLPRKRRSGSTPKHLTPHRDEAPVRRPESRRSEYSILPKFESSPREAVAFTSPPAELPRQSSRIPRESNAWSPVRSSVRTTIVEQTPHGVLSAAVDEATDEPIAEDSPRPANWAGGHFLRVADILPLVEPERKPLWRRPRVWVGVVAGVATLAGAMITAKMTRPHPTLLAPGDRLMVTAFENHTGVQALDGTLAAGLDLALEESPTLELRGVGSYYAALYGAGADPRQVSLAQARQAARVAGTKAYLYGDAREGDGGAHGSGSGYVLSVRMFETATNRQLTSVDAKAARTEEIPGAIDDLATKLRSLVGQPKTAAANGADTVRTSVPLAKEATGNMNALHAYGVGMEALGEGRSEAALRAFTSAAAIDPGFVQALVWQSWLAREQGAEAASSQAAGRAANAAASRSTRTSLLAEIAYAANGIGDLERAGAAAGQLLELNPHDAEAQLASARVLRLEGRFAEALDADQKASEESLGNTEVLRETELSLIGLDRYQAALALEDRAAAQGLGHADLAVLAAYLAKKENNVTAAVKVADAPSAGAPAKTAYARYLDNVGELGEGSTTWQEVVSILHGQAGMAGASESALSVAALNRALAGQCGAALAFAHAAGTDAAYGAQAVFRAGLSSALCGDVESAQSALTAITGDHPQPTQGAELRAAIALSQDDGETAIRELDGIQGFDATSLQPYLRALAHRLLHDESGATADLEAVLEHRGVAVTGDTNVYAIAEIELARAYAAAGDRGNSIKAYAKFLQLWNGAGPQEHLRVEAQAGVHGTTLRTQPTWALGRSSSTRSILADSFATASAPRRAPSRETFSFELPKDNTPVKGQLYPAEPKVTQRVREADLE